jgi:chemotaxis protein methyltransferase CheR
MSALPKAKFEFLSNDVLKRTGLVLGPEKAYLVDSRLGPLARKEGFSTVETLVDALMRGDKTLSVAVSEALATHETFFFRDKTPFELFENVIGPSLRKARAGRPLKVWCAAASSGQEPYSLSMLADEGVIPPVDILATDMSNSVLEKAKSGLYTQFEVQRGLPIQRLVRHFDQVGDAWKIKANLRQRIRFEQGNLLDDVARYGRQDVIFCRNVLIYFDPATKAKVLNRLANLLNDDGYLLLGAAETVVGLTEALRPLSGHRGLYAKPALAERFAAA